MLEFRGQLDRTLYRRALTTNARSVMSFGAILLVVGLWGLSNAHLDEVVSFAVPFGVSLLGVNLLFAPWLTTRNVFRTNKLVDQPFTGHLDDHGFTAQGAFGSIDLPWSSLHRARVTPEFILLFVSGQQFYIVAKRFFADDASWEAARELVRSRVEAK